MGDSRLSFKSASALLSMLWTYSALTCSHYGPYVRRLFSLRCPRVVCDVSAGLAHTSQGLGYLSPLGEPLEAEAMLRSISCLTRPVWATELLC